MRTGLGLFISSFNLIAACLITWSCQNHETHFSSNSDPNIQAEANTASDAPAEIHPANTTTTPSSQTNTQNQLIAPTIPLGSEANPVSMVPFSECVRYYACSNAGVQSGQNRAKITTDKNIYHRGEKIRVFWDSFPNMQNNWITIVPQDFETNSWCTWFWNETASFSSFNNDPNVRPGRTNGDAYFIAGEPGVYEIRGYYGWKTIGECEVIGRVTITIIN